MYRFPTHVGRWLAAASACTLVGVCAPATAGASTTSAPPPIPAGYVTLTDDTNQISIMVPPTWTDIQTGTVDVGGSTAPAIAASPNVQSFIDSFDTPGVRYIAFPFAPDPNTLIAQFGLQGGCQSISTQPYDDTGFVGVVQVGTGCGTAGQATWNMVAASLPDHAFTAVVQIQTASPADQADFDAVLSTFGTATLSPTPTTTASAATTAPMTTVATAAAPTVPTVPAPTVPVATVPVASTPTPTVAGATTVPGAGLAITDDTGLLTVEVPAAWTYRETAPSDVGQAIIYASTDGSAPEGTVPSLIYIGGEYIADTAAVLGGMGALAEGCTANPAEPYDDNVFVGQMQTFTQCNGTGLMKVIIVANPPSQSTTVTLIITMPVFDEATLSLILQTFNVTR
jgi:hypothetical protein